MDYSNETPTLVELMLDSLGHDGTLLTLSESGFDKLPAERRDEALRMNNDGWIEQMDNIRRHVE